MKPRVLVISGSMGAGKTTVMGELSDLLAARGIRHVAIDLDAISLQQVPEPLSSEIQFGSLAAVARNCLSAGIDTFVIAAAVESRQFLECLERSRSLARIQSAAAVREPPPRSSGFRTRIAR